MLQLIYQVPTESTQKEIDWLKLQGVYPAMQPHTDWKTEIKYMKFACIVDSEAALTIKLRHPLQFQKVWPAPKAT